MQDNQNKFLTTTFNTLDSELFMIFEVFEGFSKKIMFSLPFLLQILKEFIYSVILCYLNISTKIQCCHDLDR